jgi:hypothetical protein
MTRGFKTRRQGAADIAVIVNDENVSQALPRFDFPFPF